MGARYRVYDRNGTEVIPGDWMTNHKGELDMLVGCDDPRIVQIERHGHLYQHYATTYGVTIHLDNEVA